MQHRLREVRRAKGLTLKQVAEQLGGGVSFTTIGKLERGQMALTDAWINRLAQALRVLPAELLMSPERDGIVLPVIRLTDKGQTREYSQEDFHRLDVKIWSPDAYVVLSEDLPGINQLTQIFDYMIIEPHVDQLDAGGLYLLMDENGQHHARVFYETPPRFVPRSLDSSERTFFLGASNMRVTGQIVFPASRLRLREANY